MTGIEGDLEIGTGTSPAHWVMRMYDDLGGKKTPAKSEIKRLHLPVTCLVSQLLWQRSLISILSTFSLISTILPQFPSTKLSCKNIVTKKHL